MTRIRQFLKELFCWHAYEAGPFAIMFYKRCTKCGKVVRVMHKDFIQIFQDFYIKSMDKDDIPPGGLATILAFVQFLRETKEGKEFLILLLDVIDKESPLSESTRKYNRLLQNPSKYFLRKDIII